jgi:hypothetical protein
MQDSFVVCRIFQKAGPGPQNGAQYGAPFVEEEWEEDDADVGLLPVEGDAAVDPKVPRATVQIPGALERGYLQMSDLIQVWLQAVNLHVLFFFKKIPVFLYIEFNLVCIFRSRLYLLAVKTSR